MKLGIPIALLAVAFVLAACDGTDSAEPEPGPSDMQDAEQLVCGMIDPALIEKIIGDAEVETSGTGLTDATWGGPRKRAECSLRDAEATRTFLRASVSTIDDADRWRRTLEQEAPGDATCSRYDGDPGHGYGCTYEDGVFVNGAGVNVVRGDRLFRVTAYHWTEATPEQRLSTVEAIVRNIDARVTAFEENHAAGGY